MLKLSQNPYLRLAHTGFHVDNYSESEYTGSRYAEILERKPYTNESFCSSIQRKRYS